MDDLNCSVCGRPLSKNQRKHNNLTCSPGCYMTSLSIPDKVEPYSAWFVVGDKPSVNVQYPCNAWDFAYDGPLEVNHNVTSYVPWIEYFYNSEDFQGWRFYQSDLYLIRILEEPTVSTWVDGDGYYGEFNTGMTSNADGHLETVSVYPAEHGYVYSTTYDAKTNYNRNNDGSRDLGQRLAKSNSLIGYGWTEHQEDGPGKKPKKWQYTNYYLKSTLNLQAFSNWRFHQDENFSDLVTVRMTFNDRDRRIKTYSDKGYRYNTDAPILLDVPDVFFYVPKGRYLYTGANFHSSDKFTKSMHTGLRRVEYEKHLRLRKEKKNVHLFKYDGSKFKSSVSVSKRRASLRHFQESIKHLYNLGPGWEEVGGCYKSSFNVGLQFDLEAFNRSELLKFAHIGRRKQEYPVMNSNFSYAVAYDAWHCEKIIISDNPRWNGVVLQQNATLESQDVELFLGRSPMSNHRKGTDNESNSEFISREYGKIGRGARKDINRFQYWNYTPKTRKERQPGRFQEYVYRYSLYAFRTLSVPFFSFPQCCFNIRGDII